MSGSLAGGARPPGPAVTRRLNVRVQLVVENKLRAGGSLMGLRRSTVKNKKSKRTASANAVERSTVARKAARKRV